MAWARALGEFGATITFDGNFPGRTQTMPLAVYLALEPTRMPRWCCRVLLAVSLAVLVALRDRWVDPCDRSARRRRVTPGRFSLDAALRRRPGRGRRAAGPERRRQDHRAARPGRPAPPGRRVDHLDGVVLADPRAASSFPRSAARSAWFSRTIGCFPPHVRTTLPSAPRPGASARARPGDGPQSGWTGWAWPTAPARPGRSPAARPSAWPWPGRWPRSAAAAARRAALGPGRPHPVAGPRRTAPASRRLRRLGPRGDPRSGRCHGARGHLGGDRAGPGGAAGAAPRGGPAPADGLRGSARRTQPAGRRGPRPTGGPARRRRRPAGRGGRG